MPDYLSPGVYMEEVDRGPKPIEGVGTAMAAFVGFSEKAKRDKPDDLLNKSELITNWNQYKERFGGFVQGAYMPLAVYGYFLNGGSRCYVISVRTIGCAEAELRASDGAQPYLTARAKVPGYDGLKLKVKVELETVNGTPPEEATRPGALPDASPQEPAENVPAAADTETRGRAKDRRAAAPAPAVVDPTVPSAGNRSPAFKVTVLQEKRGEKTDGTPTTTWEVKDELRDVVVEWKTEKGKQTVEVMSRGNRTSQLIDLVVPKAVKDLASEALVTWPTAEQTWPLVLDTKPRELTTPSSPEDFKGEVSERKGLEGLADRDEITMLCVPDLMSAPPGAPGPNLETVKSVQTAMIAHCELMKDRVAILDAPPGRSPQAIDDWRQNITGYDSSYAALYYPWIKVDDPTRPNQQILIPPCGHVAGIWARNDNTRGVHKAPANEVMRGAVGLETTLTKGEQDVLNPHGVNCIRAFPGMGIRVWGARTLSSNPSWRYLNVRRLFNYVEKSIERSTQWVVFEPNDPFLWARVTRDVSAFLTGVWTSGALFGLVPSQAFYVKCDEELNPEWSRNEGKLIIEIGMAPVKPAEFVVFRVMQWSPTAG